MPDAPRIWPTWLFASTWVPVLSKRALSSKAPFGVGPPLLGRGRCRASGADGDAASGSARWTDVLNAAAAAAGLDEEDATALQAAHAAPLRGCEAAARSRKVNMGGRKDICRRPMFIWVWFGQRRKATTTWREAWLILRRTRSNAFSDGDGVRQICSRIKLYRRFADSNARAMHNARFKPLYCWAVAHINGRRHCHQPYEPVNLQQAQSGRSHEHLRGQV